MKFLILAFLFSATSYAQEKFISFDGLVQFSEGNTSIVSTSGETSNVVYGSPIYEDTQLKLENNSTVKFVTRANCIVILYGQGSLKASQGEKPWRINTLAARFICPEKNEEKFDFHGVSLVPNGESLFEKSGKIFVVTGTVKINQALASRHIYQYSKGKIAADTQTSQYDFDNLYKIPREGEKLKKPAPAPNAKPDQYRLSLGPNFGPSILLHANSSLNHTNYSADGATLQFTFRKELAGLILGIQYLEIESKNQNYTPGSISTSEHFKNLLVEGGYRFNFERWWSPFIRLGVFRASNEIFVNTNNYSSDNIYDYVGVNGSLGIDAMVHPSWLFGVGAFVSAEVQLNQTLFSTREQNVNTQNFSGATPDEAGNQKGFISNLNGLVGFGLLLQF